MKVVLTAYRNWQDPARIYRALVQQFPEPMRRGQYNLLVFGDCPTGGDAFAKQWARANEGRVMWLEFAAHWADLKNGAGPIRNQAMIDMINPDLVLAFLHPESRGAAGTAKYAEEKSIPVHRFWEVSRSEVSEDRR